MFYFIDPTGARYGPATLPMLNQWALEGRLTIDSIIEDASTGQRMSARFIPGFAAPPPQTLPYPTPIYHSPAYTPDESAYRPVEAPTPVRYGSSPTGNIPNHMVKALTATILFCGIPLGFVAIYYALMVDKYKSVGDFNAAMAASVKANAWGNWSIALGCVYGVVGAFMAVGAVGGALGM